jgi:hypothetical protein
MKTMKMFIAIAVALVSFGALAQNRHMVTLSGYEGGNRQDRSLDLYSSTGSNSTGTNTKTRNIALNYAYALTDTWQIGASFKQFQELTRGDVAAAGDKTTTYGLQVIYNFAHRLYDTSYLALHYDMLKADESDTTGNDGFKTNTWALEGGHRFSLGNLWGMNFNYAPSATLGFTKSTYDASNSDDTSTTALSLNFVKFDVLF